MASNAAVATVLALLHEFYPSRDMTDETLPAWTIVFRDWSDEELQACALAAAQEPSRAFFPTPGEIAAHRAPPMIDTDVLLARISKLGHYNPNVGWMYPRVEEVRAALGAAVADAYAAAGAQACFADDARDGSSTSREIARQRFTAELRTAAKRNPAALLPEAPAQQLLGRGPLALVTGESA